MKIFNLFLGLITLFIVVSIFFFSRQIFSYKYHPEYYENYFYHSQWNIPNSTRVMGDGDLYKFVGYRLAKGENPFNINYEVPPFGKLLIGLAEKYTGNPYWVNVLLYLLSIGVLTILSKDLFKNNQISLFVLLLFTTTPFIATQIKDTMLDLPLMFLLLVHIWLFIRYLSNQNINFLFFSGIFLGLFTGTKIGIYTPLIGILGSFIVLVFSKKKILYFLIYFTSVISGYVLSFISYFIQHPNPIPWIRLHAKTINFYSNSNLPVNPLNQWKTIFFNIYQGWWNPGEIIKLSDWSLILPFGTIALIIVLIFSIKKQQKEWFYISGIGLIFLIINSLIAFWPRYLIPIIPIFILLIANLTKKIKFIMIILILLNLPIFYSVLTPDTLPETTKRIATYISTRAYRDLYQNIDNQTIEEQEFVKQNIHLINQLGVRKLEVTVGEINKNNNHANVEYQIKYITKYGELTETPTLSFIKINNQWKLDWKWNYLLDNYSPTNKIIVNKFEIPKNNSESLRSLYIVPRLMSDWGQSINSLSALTGKTGTDIDIQIKTVVPDQYPQFVGYLNPKLGNEGIQQALNTHGVSIDEPEFFTPSTLTTSAQPDYYINANLFQENDKGQKTIIPVQIPN